MDSGHPLHRYYHSLVNSRPGLYDLTIPVLRGNDSFASLANMLANQTGHFRRVLAYCNSIREAERFQRLLLERGIAAWHMNGDTVEVERARILKEFSGALMKAMHVLVTVQVLGEGVNIPNADTCLFVQPRSSYVSIIQAIGRVLRHHPAKPLAHIVLPAISSSYQAASDRSSIAVPSIATAQNSEEDGAQASTPSRTKVYARTPCAKPKVRRQRQTGASKQISSDPTTAQTRSQNRRSAGRAGTGESVLGGSDGQVASPGQLDRFVLALAQADRRLASEVKAGCFSRFQFVEAQDGCGNAGVLETSLQQRVFTSLSSQLGMRQTRSWTESAETLRAFALEHGRLPAQTADSKAEKRLANWLNCQVSRFSKACLSHAQEHRLKALHPLVAHSLERLERRHRAWDDKRDKLVAFLSLFDKLPNGDAASSEERALAAYVEMHRRLAAGGRKVAQLQCLSEAHPLLESVVSAWLQECRHLTTWTITLHQVSSFLQKHDRLPKQPSTCELETYLAQWVRLQRQLYWSGGLDSDRFSSLQAADDRLSLVVTQARSRRRSCSTKRWPERFAQLKEFVRVSGRPPKLQSASYDERSLATWLMKQVGKRNKGKLTLYHVQLLSTLHPSLAKRLGA